MSDPVTLHVGDCLDVLAGLEASSVDAVVTDPPYELGFMGRAWDASGIAYNVDVWRECLRVLKPGGHLLAFGGTRTYHRMTCAIEDAGFEIRDSLHWIYGSGFPKSLDVSKAIDKAAGATREVVGERSWTNAKMDAGHGVSGLRQAGGHAGEYGGQRVAVPITAPATSDAARWQGWGTALKPAHEPIVLARKPLGGTVAATVLAHGTGGLNVDGCRTRATGPDINARKDKGSGLGYHGGDAERGSWNATAGRWPANVLLTHPPALDAAGNVVGDACAAGCVEGCPVAEMDAQSGHLPGRGNRNPTSARGGATGIYGAFAGGTSDYGPTDSGGASRYFPIFRYQAKAPKSERPRLADGTSHPTVKPLALMRWLVRLVTPPGGLIVDPFAGSGTTGEAAALEGARCVLVERDETHAELIRVRLGKPADAA